MSSKYLSFLMHYNHNHDPRNGRFTTSSRGGRIRSAMRSDSMQKAFEPGPKGKPSAAERIGRASLDTVDSTKRLVGRRKSPKQQSYKHMSNAELQKRINRLQMERRYSELSRPGLSRGRQKALDILDVTGDVMAIGVSAAIIGTQIARIKKM